MSVDDLEISISAFEWVLSCKTRWEDSKLHGLQPLVVDRHEKSKK